MGQPFTPTFDTALYPISEMKALQIAVIDTEWNAQVVDLLKNNCIDTLQEIGINPDHIHYYTVPGAYELPQAANMLIKNTARLDAVICLGCVVKGETNHDEYINHSVASALQQQSILHAKPLIYGVLTTLTMEQALDRANGNHGNKGRECAMAALKMISLNEKTNKTNRKISF